MFRGLCGDTTLKNVILVTNTWGEVSHDTGEAHENELATDFFKPALDHGAQMVRHRDTAGSTHDIIRMIVKNHPAASQIRRELVDGHKDIVGIAAGEAANLDLDEYMRRHQAELKKVRGEMEQALKEKDLEMRRELEGEMRKLQENTEEIKKDLEGMVAGYVAEKRRWEAEMREMEQAKEREMEQAKKREMEQEAKKRERVEAEYKGQLADLTRRLQDQTDASVADRARLEQVIKMLENLLGTQVTIPADESARHNTPSPRAVETAWADRCQQYAPLTPPHPPSPHMLSRFIPYVQVFLCSVTHDG